MDGKSLLYLSAEDLYQRDPDLGNLISEKLMDLQKSELFFYYIYEKRDTCDIQRGILWFSLCTCIEGISSSSVSLSDMASCTTIYSVETYSSYSPGFYDLIRTNQDMMWYDKSCSSCSPSESSDSESKQWCSSCLTTALHI